LAWADGRLASGSAFHTAKVWTPDGEVQQTWAVRDRVHDLAWSDDGLLVASREEPPKLWDSNQTWIVNAFPSADTWPVHEARITCLRAVPEGFATTSLDGHARIWNEGRLVLELKHPGPVFAIERLPDGRWMTASDQLRIWDRRGRPQTLDLPGRPTMLAVWEDEVRVVLRNGVFCRIGWDDQVVRESVTFNAAITAMAQSRTGRIALASLTTWTCATAGSPWYNDVNAD
jgi:WD40 repeat protein